MKLSVLLQGLSEVPAGAGDVDVVAVTLDSRLARPGVVFVASRGVTPASKDGHAFIADAVKAGASVVVVEDASAAPASIPTIVTKHARALAARLAERIHGEPSQQLRIAGVTGTNGKTTTTFLLASIARAAGHKGAVFGTLGVGDPADPEPSGFTTPEAEVLSARLVDVKQQGYDVVGLEVSSHALATRRVEGITFAAGGFTNLSHDHLDFHGDVESYFQAKERFFTELLPRAAPAVLPASDDEQGLHARLRKHRPDAITWGTSSNARLRAVDVKCTAGGLAFALHFDGSQVDVEAPALLGAFNVENALVAAGLALGLGFTLAHVAAGLRAAIPPPGRMQRVANPELIGRADGPVVVVDYAHTPDALERALLTARGFSNGRLFVVFGCGGDRDAAKRPVMGRIASDIADVVVVTDDNPRSEESEAILDAVAAGIGDRKRLVAGTALDHGTWARIANRRLAIRAAVRAAGSGDVVVVAGKGHERDQTAKGLQAPFDDVREAQAALSSSSRPAFLPRTFVEAALDSTFAGATPAVFAGVGTDSRALEPGSLFIPLVGDNFDGHQFVEATLKAKHGAAAALVQRSSDVTRLRPVLVVDDTLLALQALARAWLKLMPAVRIALTGSNGKTTTKELIAATLGAVVGADAVTATEGNLNNHIGVPLTALRVEAHHRFAVIEMGMNHLGEIASYCTFAPPQIGLVTNMGTAHAGNVGGVEGVAAAKAELFSALPKDGVAVVNADDARCLREAARAQCRHLSFGTAPFADLRLLFVRPLPAGGQLLTMSYDAKTIEVELPLDGHHNAVNAAGAVAVAVAVGLDFAAAAAGLAAAHPAHGRLERRRRADGLLLLDDSYNANPDSMEAGLETLKHVAAGRSAVAALGPMLELGDHAPAAHRHIGAAAAQAGVRALFVCGELGRFLEEGARAAGLSSVVWAKDSTTLGPLVAAGVAVDDVVLVKGSRGARMERVVEALLAGGH
ncbi:MAG: UDP-N-acetylmuramoyl-L-alanyl-D-glutamate--2,6-diaminopimelate ligase [Deltaproteobacteria bacterium]|nr:UDP-N-acetylmuramoyl-L-alanyl-D-glutamate--2,6-diaminopimelate ligase [Deltaproteobacteria bacterium]